MKRTRTTKSLINFGMNLTEARNFARKVSKNSTNSYTGKPIEWFIVHDEINTNRYIVIDEFDVNNEQWRDDELIECYIAGQYYHD